MRYLSGEPVEIGDRILLDEQVAGVVVCVIGSGLYSKAFPEKGWSYLKYGFLAEFEGMGLTHFSGSDEEITLVGKPGEG